MGFAFSQQLADQIRWGVVLVLENKKIQYDFGSTLILKPSLMQTKFLIISYAVIHNQSLYIIIISLITLLICYLIDNSYLFSYIKIIDF